MRAGNTTRKENYSRTTAIEAVNVIAILNERVKKMKILFLYEAKSILQGVRKNFLFFFLLFQFLVCYLYVEVHRFRFYVEEVVVTKTDKFNFSANLPGEVFGRIFGNILILCGSEFFCTFSSCDEKGLIIKWFIFKKWNNWNFHFFTLL